MKVRECRYITGAKKSSDYPPADRPEVVFLGRSNVGKSSLINTLAARRLARVSRTPGRTQQAHFFSISNDAVFVDLPGYGYARAPVEIRKELLAIIETYLTAGRPLALAALVVDARHAPTDMDRDMNGWLADMRLPVQVVSTKMDKLSRSERSTSLARSRRILGREDIIPFSSETGEGKRGLWQAIEGRIAALKTGKTTSPERDRA